MKKSRIRDNSSAGAYCIVIFGARVFKDGTPSGVLRRRVNAAIAAYADNNRVVFILTGGKGKEGPTEASVMRRLLVEAGVPVETIVAEEESKDTYDSIRHCSRIIKLRFNQHTVAVCSDRYHIPRCRWLFLLAGIPSIAVPIPSGLRANGWPRWILMYLREVPSSAWDTLLFLMNRFGQ
jgi:vancomycin permeability regulator SanA